jgi:hypothetical protein
MFVSFAYGASDHISKPQFYHIQIFANKTLIRHTTSFPSLEMSGSSSKPLLALSEPALRYSAYEDAGKPNQQRGGTTDLIH